MVKKITRRHFLGGTCAFFAGAPLALESLAQQQKPSFLPCRKRLPNPYVENGKSIVVVVHGTQFAPMLAKGMEILGGFTRLGKKNAVHLKPNFVVASPYPVTTDGLSLLTTIELLKKEGFNDITIAECAYSYRAHAFQLYDLDEKARTGGFKIKDLYDDEVVLVKDRRWVAIPSASVFKSVYETPLIINMPTLKQHSVTQFTCALKNTMGQINRITRMDMHREGIEYNAESSDRKTIMSHRAIAEIASAIDPDLTIIDARYCLGRSHHLSWGGISLKADRIIISGDALAADRVAAEVLAECYSGFKTEMASLQLDHAAHLGLGALNMDQIVIKDVSV
jgi:uncharacterized protein (DUF362 family)